MKISSSVAIILDQLDQPFNDPSADSAQIDQVTTAEFPVSETAPATGSDQIDPTFVQLWHNIRQT
jgi:hypothetical protein